MARFRFAIFVIIVLIVFGFGLLIGFVFPRFARSSSPPQIQNTATILRQVQTLSQLVTVKYVLEKVIILEDAQWYGENRVLMVAHGVVKGGINFEKLQPGDLRVTQNRIVMNLPPAIITDVYLNDQKTQVIERKTGLMRTFDKDLEQNARRQAIGELAQAARSNGIIKDAEERARAQLTSLFHQLGFSEVEFR